MAKKKKSIPPKLQAWIEARKRHRLSHAVIQMMRELGMNPKRLGKLDNHDQEPWKMPLREYVPWLYEKRFGRPRPEQVIPIEEKIKRDEAKKAARREKKRLAREAASKSAPSSDPDSPDP